MVAISFCLRADLYLAFWPKRRFKKVFDKYLGIASTKGLCLLQTIKNFYSIRNELVHSLEREIEKFEESPSKGRNCIRVLELICSIAERNRAVNLLVLGHTFDVLVDVPLNTSE